ncbi:hypothetical protein LTR09_007825 [Extremus antarcticus]|uniref:Uncharacterized protein n=1 Tax=Extremus antarcticus TaxID=702011 RepID=A0AAJ0GAW7_9PEZI|nr:hypothetical protein LTR09_007825 [Extremus antarcticus]
MRRSTDFQQRYAQGRWQPPRPRGSNIAAGSGRYQYDNWSVHPASRSTTRRRLYKTYSLYADVDRIWVFNDDAIDCKVGDGTGNPRAGRAQGAEEDENTSDDSNGEVRSTDDWVPLSFNWPSETGMFRRSYAWKRQPNGRICLQSPNNVALPELLPDRHLAPQQDRAAPPPHGALVGELPILIALVALSVQPQPGLVDQALRQQGRGIVVRVEYEPTPPAQHHRGQPVYQPEDDPVVQRLRKFERGLTVYGPFAI